jgi:hypothetical protein
MIPQLPILFIVLLMYCLLREVVFWFNTQKLLNKLMSRSYFYFKTTQNLGKLNKLESSFKIKEVDELAEDLSNISI